MSKTKTFLLMILAILLVGCGGAAEPQQNAALIMDATLPVEPDMSTMPTEQPTEAISFTETPLPSPSPTESLYPPHALQIEVMREQEYPGSEIVFERELAAGANYAQYVVSYMSEGLKNYALMTIPDGEKPETGWPSIVFNHGYIAPTEYRTTERYVAYVDAIARSGYIVLKIDFRGHDNSDGSEVVGGGYGSPGYTADALNALASLQMYADADPNRIGMWGHSMGGQVTLRAMVVSEDIKAGVIWGGVVAPYPVVIDRWDYRQNLGMFSFLGDALPQNSSGLWLQNFSDWVAEFSEVYGEYDENPDYWQTISPNSYLTDLSGPIQLNHSTTDEMVPLEWAEILEEEMLSVGMPYEFYTYEGDNHNISANFSTAMQHTIAFFDMYVKGQ